MVASGLERFVADGFPDCRGRRVGLLCHGASVDRRLRYAFDLMVAGGVDLRFILAPEHGLFGEIPYMERVEDFRLEPIGVPVVSLYRDTSDQLKPPEGLMDEVDVIVCDIQDVGSRYYTYVATMAMTMDACSGRDITFIVLDRPNPVGLEHCEGNVCGPDVRSFVSHLPLRSRHGLTVGEIARYHADTAGLDLNLKVVACDGLTRQMDWAATGLPFVPPSPNIPDVQTALVYTGMCLLEGTNLSEGRGTASPFLFAGAPWIRDPWGFCHAIDAAGLPGVVFRPVRFTPKFDKHAGTSCGGIHMVVTDPRAFNSLLTGLTVVSTAARMFPDDFRLRADAYEFVTDIPALDLLLGDRESSTALLSGADPRDVLCMMNEQARPFEDRFRLCRLYGDKPGGA